MSFAAASAITRVADLGFSIVVPDGWQQGRGAFGGLVVGVLTRAMEACEPDRSRRIRTVSCDICGPVMVGPAEISVRVLRRGSHQTNLAAELRQGGDTLAIGSAIAGHARKETKTTGLDSAPPAGDWRTGMLLPIEPPLAPVFTSNYEYRADETPLVPFEIPQLFGWLREKEPLAALDAAAMVARLDAWYPCLFGAEGRQRPVATISFLAEIIRDPVSLDPREPLRYRARMVASHEGHFVELRELWSGEQVVALNQQTFAVLK